MEKYAVIKFASKQFLVQEGDVIELERQKIPLKISVLMYRDGSKRLVGEPELKEVSVKAVVLEEKLGKKVRVARFKKKSGYEKVKGHRQPMSIIKIEKISIGTEKAERAAKAEAKKVEKTEKPVKKPAAKKPVKKTVKKKETK
ncbi:MAG: 50S ribosomal protein L21 [Patescibacteria group bacterium]|nr:50S ribosomal protein L21 [Patescibacteria group bacterium]MBU1952966.1 50S ribosomal protein L21 [Patescibacteria group bacterium]